MSLRVLIADDEALARERLRRLLEQESDVAIIAECSNGEETLQAMREHLPDVVMIDVCMPELNAFEVIAASEQQPGQAVILVTAHDEFAVRAFETAAVDYLLKPFDAERLKESIRRARTKVEKARQASALGAVLDRLKSLKPVQRTIDRITVKSNGRLLPVRVADIEWIQSANNYCELHVGKKAHLIRQPLATLESELPAGQFIRISRSLMVNIDSILELRIKSHGDLTVVLRDGEVLTASRNYRTPLLARLGGAK